jgi:hypothetical protein
MKNCRLFVSVLLVALLVLIVTGPSAADGGDAHDIFSTWEGFEPDKCASIWLIKRFINPQAAIKLFPKGEAIAEGIAFDTPDAKFKRTHNMSTFESLVKHFQINDPKILQIGKIIHDVEINTWERKLFDLTPKLQQAINDIIEQAGGNVDVVAKSISYFDSLYDKPGLE